ncbi:hypothetical protein [Zoogloea sp.]|uniref:hypothetical protein n=1 Tax=Zoogloea sp. TaxID=49181 RepID=UPI002629CF65|nr:hypothetical protein [Zoogloea sp.]
MALIFLLLVMLGVFSALGILITVTHVAKAIGIATFCILIVALFAVGYIGVFVSSISAAVFFQWWGSDIGGWALLAGGCLGLLISIGIIVSIVDEIKARTQFVSHFFRRKSPCDKRLHQNID